MKGSKKKKSATISTEERSTNLQIKGQNTKDGKETRH